MIFFTGQMCTTALAPCSPPTRCFGLCLRTKPSFALKRANACALILFLPLQMVNPHPFGRNVAFDLAAEVWGFLRRLRARRPEVRGVLHTARMQPAVAYSSAFFIKVVIHRVFAIGKGQTSLHEPASEINTRNLTTRHPAPYRSCSTLAQRAS